jgi:YVTN family beta-propeller protein
MTQSALSPLHSTAGALMRALRGSAVGFLSLPALAFSADFHIYVTNEGSGDLSVISGSTQAVIATWPVGKRPRGLAASPDGRHLYVALTGSPQAGPGVDEKALPPADKAADGIGVVQVDSGHLQGVFTGVSDPEQLAVSIDGTRLYVASEDTGRAVVMASADGSIVSRIDVGGEPEGVAVDRRTGLAGVTSETDDCVTLLDAHGGRALGRIAVGQRPRDLAFTPDGARLFVTGENDASLTVIDVKSHTALRTLHLQGEGARPKGVLISPDGTRVYISTGRGAQVVALDAQDLHVLGSVQVGQRPWGLALSPDGRYLYTANGPSNDVSVVDTAQLKVIATIPVGKRPWGVAVIPDR